MRVLVDGEGVTLGRSPRFHGQHVLVPRTGVAVHINAFNFPAWGLAEKAAAALLAGMPVVSKPATSSALVAHRMVEILVEAQGAARGRALAARGARGRPARAPRPAGRGGLHRLERHRRADPLACASVIENSVRVNVEADSLNAAVLGPDVEPGSETCDCFLKDVLRDMTQKAGQKCTAIRRVLVPRRDGRPRARRPGRPPAGDRRRQPRARGRAHGAGRHGGAARTTCATGIDQLARDGRLVFGSGAVKPVGVPEGKGFFVSPVLVEVEPGAPAPTVHAREVFGPVATIVPYTGSADDAAEIVARGRGGLVSSVYSDDAAFTADVVLGLAPFHGRVFLGSAKIAEASPGPGTVLPQLVHGGPGRAGRRRGAGRPARPRLLHAARGPRGLPARHRADRRLPAGVTLENS